MKARVIKTVLRRKVDGWLTSIEDPHVKELASKNTIVTGGAIPSLLLNEQVNDFDIYFKTQEAALVVARYYVDKFKQRVTRGLPSIDVVLDTSYKPARIKVVVKSAGVIGEDASDVPYQYFEGDADPDAIQALTYVEGQMQLSGDVEETYEKTKAAALEAVSEGTDKSKYRPIFLSTNAITLAGRVQLVLRFYGEPNEIHENYDFVHCTNYWTSWDGELVLKPAALEAILGRELRYVGSKYPLCSLMRIRKFIKRGWHINAGQILKMSMQISKLDLEDLKVLEDQLTGVDVAYFAEVIEKLKKKDKERVESAYLLEIIERMF